ncbi:unnamed protein product [Cylicocyclus nassatus]|uniref:Uncharacterized protein n=1 Tax=Cylicocyclus nassatus TaxID=53992 RepID=A0AA36H7R8_CYLNA|nr:unnamed protein product [Cylicocyclus nassatus]
MMALSGHLLTFLLTSTFAAVPHVLHCDNNVYCSRRPGRSWHNKRKVAELLALNGGKPFRRNSSLIVTHEQKEYLCHDELFTGFLLDKDALKWEVSCLWAGNGMHVACAPVPDNYSSVPFAYIPPPVWQKKIRDFRVKIRCSKERINKTWQIPELFICNERCIQAGIGYVPSLIMLLSFSIAFIKNCLL